MTSLPAKRRDGEADSSSKNQRSRLYPQAKRISHTHMWVSSNFCSVFVGGEKAFLCLLRTGKACFLGTSSFSFHHHYMFVESIPSQACTQARASLLSIPLWDRMELQPAHFNTFGKCQSEEELLFRTGTWVRCRDIFSSSHYKPKAFRIS